jgi:hypothetical protein
MTTPAIKALARRIWDDLGADHAERSKVAKALAVALREVRDETKPARVISNSNRDVAPIIEKLIGRTLTQVEGMRIPFGGVSINVPTIIRASQEPTHPYYEASAAFMAKHGLTLETIYTSRKPKVRIVRADPAPAQILERVKATAAGVLERRDAAYREYAASPAAMLTTTANSETVAGVLERRETQVSVRSMTLAEQLATINAVNTANVALVSHLHSPRVQFMGKDCSGGIVTDFPADAVKRDYE